MADSALRAFEVTRKVLLPSDYRRFVAEVGNGIQESNGEWFVFPLGHSFDLTSQVIEPWAAHAVGDVSAPFPFDRAVREDEDDDSFDWEWADGAPPGAFPIAYHGDTIFSYLVTAGPERGCVWNHESGQFNPCGTGTHRRLAFLDWLLRELQRDE